MIDLVLAAFLCGAAWGLLFAFTLQAMRSAITDLIRGPVPRTTTTLYLNRDNEEETCSVRPPTC